MNLIRDLRKFSHLLRAKEGKKNVKILFFRKYPLLEKTAKLETKMSGKVKVVSGEGRLMLEDWRIKGFISWIKFPGFI